MVTLQKKAKTSPTIQSWTTRKSLKTLAGAVFYSLSKRCLKVGIVKKAWKHCACHAFWEQWKDNCRISHLWLRECKLKTWQVLSFARSSGRGSACLQTKLMEGLRIYPFKHSLHKHCFRVGETTVFWCIQCWSSLQVCGSIHRKWILCLGGLHYICFTNPILYWVWNPSGGMDWRFTQESPGNLQSSIFKPPQLKNFNFS